MKMTMINRAGVIGIVGLAVAAATASLVSGDEPIVTALRSEVLRAAGVVVLADHAVGPDGHLIDDAVLVVDARGRIREFGSAAELGYGEGEPRRSGGREVIELPDGAVLCPGLVAVGSELWVSGGNYEQTKSIDPSLSVIEAFDGSQSSVVDALKAGITSTMVIPRPNNVVCGTAAVLKTWPCGPETGSLPGDRVLRDDGPVVLALGPSTWDFAGEPTSRAGALALIRREFDSAKDADGDDEASVRMRQLVSGELDSIVWAAEVEDVQAVVRVLMPRGVNPVVFHGGNPLECGAWLKETGKPVVLGPLGFGSGPGQLYGPAALSQSGVEIAFAGQMPVAAPDSLRISAALAARYGMDAAAARRAITSVPAAVAGVSDRVGSFAPGLDADFVVFSGDPISLSSSVLEVWVNGTRVMPGAIE
ncbi:MAG: amidohydrolase family protein [Planctomycetes bacterium]|nr:amidohydrolase family protein [Planctomycetota bacterium]